MLIAFKKLILVCLLLLAGETQADSAISKANSRLHNDISYCNQANLGFVEATQCEYQPLQKNVSSGFTEGYRWVRLRVSAPTLPAQAIAIHVGPHFLSDIRLFEKKDGGWISQVAGSHLPASDSHAAIGGYSFIVHAQANDVSTYYLRIKATSLSNFFIVAEPWPATQPYNHKLGIGMQMGALLLISTFALISYLLNPNQVMFRFCLLMLVIVACLAAGSGLLAQYLLPESPILNQYIFSLLLCLRLALWIALARALMKPYRTPNWYALSCHVTYGIAAVSMLLIAFNYPVFAYSLVLAAMLIAPMVQMLAISNTSNMEKAFKWVMLTGFFIQTLLIALLAVVVNYSIAGSYLPIYVARMTDFGAPLVLLSIILFQQRIKNTELNQAKTALLESELRSRFELKQLAERGLLIDMLTHELKNPLAAIGMASGSLSHDLAKAGITENRRLDNIKLSIDNMDRIIERCVLMNAVDRQEQIFYKVPVDLHALLARCLAHFDQAERLHLKMDAAHSVQTDAYLLEIAINNLIGNALKYSPPNSPIEITVYKQASQIKIAIANQIYSELAPDETALFKRFYRHPLAHNVSGSGLGLYLTKGLCQLLDANVSYTKKEYAVEFLISLKA
jgi:signal transduction histidine kinase